MISIPNWISSRTYFFGTAKSRTYIINEKSQYSFFLEGLSSDLWFYIINNSKKEDIISFAKEKKLENKLDNFIKDLKELDLIEKKEIKKECSYFKENYKTNLDIDFEKYENEKKSWLINNNFLYSLLIELTYNCNEKCIHCYNPKEKSNEELTFEQIKPIIDEAYELGIAKVILSGGECTLAKDFLKIAQYIRKRRLSLEIFTNGQSLYENSNLLNEIIKLYPNKIALSLYSMEEKIHDKITQISGSQKKTLDIIYKLKKENIPIEIKSIQLKPNANEYKNIVELGKEIGASVSLDTYLVPRKYNDHNFLKLAATEEQLLNMYLEIDSPMYIRNFIPQKLKDKCSKEKLCLGGRSFLVISPTLNCSPCLELPEFNYDLNVLSLREIWKDKNNFLHKWNEATKQDLKDCYKEDFCRYCNYCKKRAMLLDGYLKKSDTLCYEAKIKQKAAVIIESSK